MSETDTIGGHFMDPERPSIGKVYDAINDIKVDVAVIMASLPDIKDHESRIRAIEKRQWSFAGLATISGAALSQIIEQLINGN